MTVKKILFVLIGIITVLYPFVVYYGIRYFEPWIIAVLLCILLGLRFLLAGGSRTGSWGKWLLLVGAAYCCFAVWRNELDALRLYPVVVNTAMLVLFLWSLYSPPSLIEQLARLQHPDLPPEGVVYTRRVTQVWCLFFVVNGSIALATALWGNFETWSVYNGFVAYMLMGVLFAGEYIVRMKTQKHVR